MLFNLISIIGLLVSVVVIYLLSVTKQSNKIVKLMCLIMLVFKTTEYVIMNLMGEVTYPIEISTITYFMFSIVVLFDIKKLFHIASFFAIISGVGFFLYYSLFGFISSLYFDVGRHVVAVTFHGILLIGGVYLFSKNVFDKAKKNQMLVVMLMIIAHGSIFYLDSIEGTTFIYFLVNPKFLQIFGNFYLNHILTLGYYLVAFSIFVV